MKRAVRRVHCRRAFENRYFCLKHLTLHLLPIAYLLDDLFLLTFVRAVGTTPIYRLRLIVPLQYAQDLCLHLLDLMLHHEKIWNIWICGGLAVIPFSAGYQVGRVGS